MRKLISALMLVMFGLQAFGCSTPDDPLYTDLVQQVGALPPSQLQAAKNVWKAHDIYRWIVDWGLRSDQPHPRPDDPIFKQNMFEITCTDKGGEPPLMFGRTVKEFITCMNVPWGSTLPGGLMWARSFSECVAQFKRTAHDHYIQHSGAEDRDVDCQAKLAPEFSEAPVKEWTDSGTDEDLVRELIESDTPPAWFWWLGVVVVGGIVVIAAPEFLPALCLLGGSDHWSCPSSPLYPPGQTPQPTGDQ